MFENVNTGKNVWRMVYSSCFGEELDINVGEFNALKMFITRTNNFMKLKNNISLSDVGKFGTKEFEKNLKEIYENLKFIRINNRLCKKISKFSQKYSSFKQFVVKDDKIPKIFVNVLPKDSEKRILRTVKFDFYSSGGYSSFIINVKKLEKNNYAFDLMLDEKTIAVDTYNLENVKCEALDEACGKMKIDKKSLLVFLSDTVI